MYNFNKCLKNQSRNWDNHAEVISLYKEDIIQMKCEGNQKNLAQVVALIDHYSSSISPTTSTSIMIIDPMFPDHEACSSDSTNTIFGRLFGIPCKTSDRKWFIQRVSNNEILCIYSIPVSSDHNFISV